MKKVQVHGKIMLSGEYAVLHGGTAVLMPVPNYLTVYEREGDQSGQLSPIVQKAFEIPVEETKAYEKSSGLPKIEIDDSQFYSLSPDGKRVKLGLGLSAAEAVGVIAFRFERAGLSWSGNAEKIIRYAYKVHNEVQGGAGSGADIAACGVGHPIKFKIINNKMQIDPIDPEHEDNLPPLKLVWTGVAADTREYVRKFSNWLASDSKSKNMLQKLIETSNALAEAWFTVPPDSLFKMIDEFEKVMRDISNSANLGMFLPIHDELARWARDNGGRAKPTGAGGGDMVLLVGDLPVRDPQETIIPIKSS
jgi:phosphomevalonate kinase